VYNEGYKHKGEVMNKNYCEIIDYRNCNKCNSIYAQRTKSDFKNGIKNCFTCYENRMEDFLTYNEIEVNNNLSVVAGK
jgi:hypothetical protein